jgi:hypothetical protein
MLLKTKQYEDLRIEKYHLINIDLFSSDTTNVSSDKFVLGIQSIKVSSFQC